MLRLKKEILQQLTKDELKLLHEADTAWYMKLAEECEIVRKNPVDFDNISKLLDQAAHQSKVRKLLCNRRSP